MDLLGRQAVLRLRPLIFLVAFLTVLVAEPNYAVSEEVSLFDREGVPKAYIAMSKEATIYLWSGEPVAYLDNSGSVLSIYGFNGKHLGWFADGIIRDHEGDAVGFMEGAVRQSTQHEPHKSYKEYSPYRDYKEYAPYYPSEKDEWSRTPLSIFLGFGQKE
jgi:hypothetical protein